MPRNCRSFHTLLPHKGAFFLSTHCSRNERVACSASLALTPSFRMRSTNPLWWWCLVFQSSMPSMSSSETVMARFGPVANTFSSPSVTTVAISMMDSFSRSSPVISKSIQTMRCRRSSMWAAGPVKDLILRQPACGHAWSFADSKVSMIWPFGPKATTGV